jgi:hypothetical protein
VRPFGQALSLLPAMPVAARATAVVEGSPP